MSTKLLYGHLVKASWRSTALMIGLCARWFALRWSVASIFAVQMRMKRTASPRKPKSMRRWKRSGAGWLASLGSLIGRKYPLGICAAVAACGSPVFLSTRTMRIEEAAIADAFVDERQLGELVGHLIRFTISGVPWLVPLTKHLMGWTLKANGPTRDERWRSDNRPSDWNCDFFDFVGVLSVALPHADVVAIVQPITDLHDDAFHDCAAAFLRGFDRSTLATDTKFPETPAAVRRVIADRIKDGWNYRRFEDEKTFTSETHAGDALTAIYYQPPAFMNFGQTSLPAKWIGLDATIEALTELAVGAPASGYIAELFLNMIKTSPRAALLPFVVTAATAWGRPTEPTSTSGRSEMFWRTPMWLDRGTIDEDPTCASKIVEVRYALFTCLDVLVRSSVAQASEVENRILRLLPDRKTA